MATVRMSKGKFDGINAVVDQHGVIAAIAIDQRGSLQKAIAKALRAWLSDRGVKNIQALNKVLAKGAKPWWDFYGGRENIEVIGLPR